MDYDKFKELADKYNLEYEEKPMTKDEFEFFSFKQSPVVTMSMKEYQELVEAKEELRDRLRKLANENCDLKLKADKWDEYQRKLRCCLHKDIEQLKG